MITVTRCFLTCYPRILSFTAVRSTNLADIRLSVFGLRNMASSCTTPTATRKTFWDFQPVDSMFAPFLL